MAKHVDPTGELVAEDVGAATKASESEAPEEITQDPVTTNGDPDDAASDTYESPQPRGRRGSWISAAALVALVVALGALAGWQTMRSQQIDARVIARTQLVDAARQGAVALTTIDAAHIDADVQKILDASTGTFRDDFEHRSQPFVQAVVQAQSKTEGTVTAAGIESIEGARTNVLVSVTVRTANGGEQEAEPRSWRMRIGMESDESGAKMSDVQFVP